MFTLKAKETTVISVDNIQTFENKDLNELYIDKGEYVAKNSKKLLDRAKTKNILCINVMEKHPYGHISFASSYKYKRTFETISYKEIQNEGEHILSKTAAFNFKQLSQHLKKNDPQMLRPDHSVNRTQGAMLTPPLSEKDFDMQIIKVKLGHKEAYSAFDGTTLHKTLQKKSIKNIIICGVAIDYCVGKIASDAKKLGYQVYIINSATAGVAPKTTKAKASELKKNNVVFCETNDFKIENGEHILAINAGSSSIKYTIYQTPSENKVITGSIENIGQKKIERTHTEKEKTKKINTKSVNHATLIKELLSLINKSTHIDRIWHRIVHGGSIYRKTTKISKKVLEDIEKYGKFAPLHNPIQKKIAVEIQKKYPTIPQYAIFDTNFHQTMPEKNYTYAIPKKFRQEGIRKYGFHGISHQYLYEKTKELANKKNNKIKTEKVITCHIGNGASITAIKNGKSLENSMGLTPTEGLIMGTRSGNIDPSAITYIMAKHKISAKKMDEILTKESGVLWIYEKNSHLQNVINDHLKKNPTATLAFNMFCNSIIKQIGAYVALLNWVDTIIFSGGVLSGSHKEQQFIRKEICKKMGYLNIQISNKKNCNRIWTEQIITTPNSKITVIVIPTDEELMIAKECTRF